VIVSTPCHLFIVIVLTLECRSILVLWRVSTPSRHHVSWLLIWRGIQVARRLLGCTSFRVYATSFVLCGAVRLLSSPPSSFLRKGRGRTFLRLAMAMGASEVSSALSTSDSHHSPLLISPIHHWHVIGTRCIYWRLWFCTMGPLRFVIGVRWNEGA
jgi:hypothetical protein